MLWMLIGFLVSVLLLLVAAGGLVRHVLRERRRTLVAHQSAAKDEKINQNSMQ